MNWDWADNPALSSRKQNEETHTPSERFVTCPIFECVVRFGQGLPLGAASDGLKARTISRKHWLQEKMKISVRIGSWALRSSHSWVELTIKFKKINIHIFYRLLSFLSSTAAMCPSAFFFPILNLLFPQITQSEQSCQIREKLFPPNHFIFKKPHPYLHFVEGFS